LNRSRLLKKLKFWLVLLGFVLWAPAFAQAAEVSMFGPETFVRSTGSPVTVTNTFSVPLQRDGIIRIQNSLLDDPVTGQLVSSSTITLNGVAVVTPNNFNQTVTYLDIPVSLVAGANTLTLEIRGKPGTGLILETFAFNESPVAAFTTTPTPATGPVPLTVSFDASASTDPDITNSTTTDILTYAWDFEDGATGTGVTASHQYATPGTFTATLTVTDAFGLSSTATASITATNTAPVAAFTPTPATGPVPLTVSFDASASTDAENNIATYAWDFGDGATGTGITTSHEYTTPGTFTATLTVTDAFGLSGTATASIEVINTAPVAAFTPTPGTGNVPLTISFDASASTDAENNISTYAWNFGDGTTGTGITTSHIYTTPGTFTATLTVTDVPGLTDTATASITATNTAPVAAFTPTIEATPLLVSFDASASTDAENNIATYAWDFGDGTTGTGVTTSHQYSTGGTVTVTLTVTDDFGLPSTTTADVVLGQPPVAAFTTSSLSGPVPLTVTFDASTSTDPDNDITTYAWDFGDTAVGTGINTTHEYATPGTFTATLTVTDAAGLSSTATASITATNTAPVATILARPASGLVPLTVAFDGSSSTDAENNIATYAWDFGDGSNESVIGTTHVYNSGGVFTVTLTVTDAFGLSSQATTTVEVVTNQPPTLQINSPPAGRFAIQKRPEIILTFFDDKAVDTASLTVTANGTSLAVDCQFNVSSAICTPTADLPEGDVTLSATISDLEAEMTTTSTSFFVDSIPAEVAIFSPIDRSITTATQTVVTGAIGPTVVSVEVNGIPATITGLDFSATVPLREGKNMLIATARNVNNKTGVSTVDVTRDIQKPIVRINSPRDGFPAVENRVTITGVVNDIVDGGVAPTVTLNGTPVPVVNGTFIGVDLELGFGPNTIEAVATDAVGNTGNHSITVNFQPQAGPKLVLSSGNGQQAQVGAELVQPLAVKVLDAEGLPVAGRTVRFEVTRNNGTLSGSGMVVSNRIIGGITDGNGEAKVNLTLGDTAGGGNNRVKATSTGVAGEIEFCATGLPNPPDKIINSMGNNQRGVIGEPLPVPLEALAVDAGGNPAADLEVTFTVAEGGGSFDNGQSSTTVITGSDGIARAVFALGFEPGINNNVVTATFQGLTGLVTTFTASGLVSGDPANTTFNGVVFDNAQSPIPGATVTIEGTTTVSGITDANGQFLLTEVPVGNIHLNIDPSTSPRTETFPPLAFESVVIAGIENTLGRPIHIPQVDMANSKVVGGTQDVSLTMENMPGVELKVFANSVTFPDGSKTGVLSLSQVQFDKIPMAPATGVIPSLAWTIQPAGVIFDPPAQISLPNSNGLSPGAVVGIDQFDHDLFTFVRVAQGTVSEDGLSIASDPGFGITRAGWGCSHDPPPPPTCTNKCDEPGNICIEGTRPFPPDCKCKRRVVVNPPQIEGNCRREVCDPNGKLGDFIFDGDPPVDDPQNCQKTICDFGEKAKAMDKDDKPLDKCKKCPDTLGDPEDIVDDPVEIPGVTIGLTKETLDNIKFTVRNIPGVNLIDVDEITLSTDISLGGDCCKPEDGEIVKDGFNSVENSIQVTVGLKDIPLTAVPKVRFRKDFGSALDVDLEFAVGAFLKANYSTGGKTGIRKDKCKIPEDDCNFGFVELKNSIQVTVDLKPTGCLTGFLVPDICVNPNTQQKVAHKTAHVSNLEASAGASMEIGGKIGFHIDSCADTFAATAFLGKVVVFYTINFGNNISHSDDFTLFKGFSF
jgi:PKD repeat protein